MSDALPEEITALIDPGVESGAADPGRRDQPKGRRVRSVDFSRPTKFTSDQERKLRRAVDAFSRSASTRLSAELRVPIELEVINSSQLVWSNAHAQLPQTAICGVVEIKPIGTRMLLAVELPLVLSSIEWLLGGSSQQVPRERRLTEIDWVLARHFFGTLLAQLSVIWNDLASLELELETLETHLETAQVAPVSEPTLALTIEAKLARSTSTIHLLIPYAAIAPVAAVFSADDYAGQTSEALTEVVKGALSEVEVTLRAEIAAVELTVGDVLAMQEGDLLQLHAPAENGVTLFADNAPVCRALPGRRGVRRAIQVDPLSAGGPS